MTVQVSLCQTLSETPKTGFLASRLNEDAIDIRPHLECNVLLDEFPTVMETRKAVQQLSSGKDPGADAIPAEVYKTGGYPCQRN